MLGVEVVGEIVEVHRIEERAKGYGRMRWRGYVIRKSTGKLLYFVARDIIMDSYPMYVGRRYHLVLEISSRVRSGKYYTRLTLLACERMPSSTR